MPHRPVKEIIGNQTLVSVGPDASTRRAAQLMKESKTGSVVVIDGGRLVGIFTERDALNRVLAAGIDPDTTPVSAVMTANPISIAPSQSLVNALHLMHDGGFRHMPVVDGDRPVGMVSIRDAIGMELARFEADIADKEAIAEIIA